MSTRASAWLAWTLAGLSVAMFLASVILYVLAHSSQQAPSTGDALRTLLLYVPFLVFPIVGALIASRHPKNPVAGSAWPSVCSGCSLPWETSMRPRTQW